MKKIQQFKLKGNGRKYHMLKLEDDDVKGLRGKVMRDQEVLCMTPSPTSAAYCLVGFTLYGHKIQCLKT